MMIKTKKILHSMKYSRVSPLDEVDDELIFYCIMATADTE